jgi:hypothetical protein
MKNKTNKSERVKVYVRIRPFTNDELKINNATQKENIDLINNTMTGKNIFIKKNKKKK